MSYIVGVICCRNVRFVKFCEIVALVGQGMNVLSKYNMYSCRDIA